MFQSICLQLHCWDQSLEACTGICSEEQHGKEGYDGSENDTFFQEFLLNSWTMLDSLQHYGKSYDHEDKGYPHDKEALRCWKC